MRISDWSSDVCSSDLIDTDRGDTLIFHLGMSGKWRIDPGEIGTHDHLVLETEEGRRLALNDPRRFGSIDILPTEALGRFPAFAKMGPEPTERTRGVEGKSVSVRVDFAGGRTI